MSTYKKRLASKRVKTKCYWCRVDISKRNKSSKNVCYTCYKKRMTLYGRLRGRLRRGLINVKQFKEQITLIKRSLFISKHY